MKANAPEKIYIHPDIGGREFLRPWLHRPANNESVEYVRKDAFIEKIYGWLKDCSSYEDSNGKTRLDEELFNTMVDDFKKYTEGWL